MNFGKWIVVSFVLFTLFIGTLVILSIREDISLVSKDYYKDELAYQQQIQRMNNTEALKKKPTFNLIDNEMLRLNWGDSATIERGTLQLFCPSNAKLDRLFNLQTGSVQFFDLKSLPAGMYRLKMIWLMNGLEYYFEKEIYI